MDDEIIIGIETPKTNKKTKVKKTNSKKAVKKAASNKKTSSSTKNVTKKNNIKNIETAKKQKKKNKAKKILIFFLIIILFCLMLSSNLFNVNNISVTGNSQISTEEIISLSQISKYTNIFKVDILNGIENIKENAYIENVTIKRKIPNEIQIEVKERVPKYLLQFADSYVYINNQGYMLEISNEKLEIPILIGVTTDLSNIKAGNRINLEDLKKMDMVIEIYETAKRNEIANLITKIDISNEKNYTLILDKEGKTVYLGDCSELNTRMLYLKDILDREKGNSGEIFLNVDLNEQRVRFREST